MRKNFIPWNFSWRVSAESWDASCFKKGLLEKTSSSKHLRHIAIEKDIFSELNRCIFQISLKYIKLVIPKIVFILALCNFNFSFKFTWTRPPSPHPPPNKINPPQQYNPPNQNKNFWPPPPAKTFLTPSKQRGGCMPCWW